MSTLKVEDILANVQALCEEIDTGYTFLAEPNIPLGTISPDDWGVTFPLGLITMFRHSQSPREGGTVGNIPGRPNQILIRLLDSLYTPTATRVAERQTALDLYNGLKDLLVAPTGQPCMPGVEWATVERERQETLSYAGQAYVGSYIVVSLDQRYNL